jgi:hypothetical protein
MAHIADADPIATSIAAFGGVDFLVALEPVMRQEHDRLHRAFEQQGLGGAIVGLQTAKETTIDLDQPRAEGVRINVVASAENADLAQVAEAIAFLGSLRAAAIDHSILNVGPGGTRRKDR